MTGKDLKKRRESAKLPVKRLADFLGVSIFAIYRWEEGSRPIPKMLEIIMNNLEFLMGREPGPETGPEPDILDDLI